jgi:hypothetical protein
VAPALGCHPRDSLTHVAIVQIAAGKQTMKTAATTPEEPTRQRLKIAVA